ncbi:MAG: Rv3235 family protein [Pontimonas sp.]
MSLSCFPVDDVRGSQRIRAVALRLEGFDRRWRATSFTVL